MSHLMSCIAVAHTIVTIIYPLLRHRTAYGALSSQCFDERNRQEAKCCAPQLPRQFGEGESVVFTSDMVPKTRTLFLKRSTKRYQVRCLAA